MPGARSTTTAIGNSTLAGKAARNCATGCTRSAQAGRRPIQTPIGTQIRLASAISTSDAEQGEQAEPEGRRRRRCRSRRRVNSEDRASSAQATTASTTASHRRSSAAADRRSRDGARPRRPRDAQRQRETSAASAARWPARRGRTSRVRRTQVVDPGLRRVLARRSARSGTCRPRRRSAGRAAGRRAGSPRAMATTAQTTAADVLRRWPAPATSRCRAASTVVLPTVIASEATTKNQPPDIDIIVFQTRPGVANGASSRQNRRQGDRPKCAADLVEVARHGAQRLVEAEGHVPGLGGEDGEDRGALRAELAAGEQAHEEDRR